MTYKEIHELIKMIDKFELAEFQLKEGDFEISIKTSRFKDNLHTSVISNVAAPAALPANQNTIQPSADKSTPQEAENVHGVSKDEETEETQLLDIKSPIVGTFYRSSSPDKPPYVKVGDSIDTGTVVCIVEAMKLFNEIESEVSGKIVEVLVEDASPVEYDQILFRVDPRA